MKRLIFTWPQRSTYYKHASPESPLYPVTLIQALLYCSTQSLIALKDRCTLSYILKGESDYVSEVNRTTIEERASMQYEEMIETNSKLDLDAL